MNLPRQISTALKVGGIAYAIHFALALAMFVNVHTSNSAQREFAWMLFMGVDYPTSELLWDHVAPSRAMQSLMDWSASWAGGPNVRAFVMHGVLAGLQWLVAGASVAYL